MKWVANSAASTTSCGSKSGCNAPLLRRDAPHSVADVIRDEQRAILRERDADRPAARAPVLIEKTGKDVDGRSRRRAASEGNKNHFIAAARLAVPGTVLPDERAVRKFRGGGFFTNEGESERGRMRAERVIRRNCGGDEIGPLWSDALVDMGAEIAVRPASRRTRLRARSS